MWRWYFAGWPFADSTGRQRYRVRQELPVLHDDEDVEPPLPAGDMHQGDDHQLHGDETGAGRSVAQVGGERISIILFL